MEGDTPTPPQQRRDHSRLAGWYMIILGAVCLLSCNLTGFLFIWFGSRVGTRDETFRKASLVLLGLYLLALFGLVLWASMFGAEGITVYLFMNQIKAPATWLVWLVALPLLVVFGLPFYWLWRDSYRRPPGGAEAAQLVAPNDRTTESAS